MGKVSDWLRATVDNKPWWAIILAACLASIGSETAKSIPNLISLVRSYYPIEPTIFVSLKNNGAGPPLDGPKISIMDVGSQSFLPMLGSGGTSVAMKDGIARLKVRLMPGIGYLLVLTSEEGGKTLRTAELIEIRGDLQYPLKFDRNNWPPSEVAPKNAPGLSTASAVDIPAELPPWMKAAYSELGQTEKLGSQSNPRILEYFRSTQIPNPPQEDQTDWSSAFIHWVLKQSGISGTGKLSGRSWLTWGAPTEVKPGCIGVFWVLSPEAPQAHVAFVVSIRPDNTLAILGGNQSDAVKIILLPRSRLLSCRWPT